MSSKNTLFPYTLFPFRLEYKEDGNKKICWFQAYEHLAKHIDRYNISLKSCKIDVKPGVKVKAKELTKKTKDRKQKKLFSTLETFFNG